MLTIGPYRLPNRVALAPMAGVTDLPFRRLCRRLGAGLVVSEMVSSRPDLRDSRKTTLRLRHDSEAEPRSVQIAGSDPDMMAGAARFNVDHGAQVIDINMGCPAKKVCRKAAGSALLADETLVAEILNAVTASVDVPVTLKIRTGTSPGHRNAVTIARIAEEAGIAALAVHGRTRACAFKGPVEYDTIAEVVHAVEIPVFANGDINSPQRAAAVMAHTGAAGVMIGRAAQGRPWLPGQIATFLETGAMQAEPAAEEQVAILLEHVTHLHDFYGDYMGLRIARKHVSWYLQQLEGYRQFKTVFNALEDPQQQLEQLQQIQQIQQRQLDLEQQQPTPHCFQGSSNKEVRAA